MADANKELKAKMKAQDKEAKAAKRAQRKATRSQIWTAFNMQRKEDKALIPIMILAVVVTALVFFLLGMSFGQKWFMLIIGIMLGALLAVWLFTKRLEKTFYTRAADQAGAGAWFVENLKDGPGMIWRKKIAVAATTQMDAVHRIVGTPGIILVGEGEPHRLKPLMEQQKKKLNRISGHAPIYEFYVGDGEGQTPVKNLQKEIMKLPRNYKKNDVPALAARVESMDAQSNAAISGIPKGPLPKNAKMSGMNRRMRRHSGK